MSIKAVGKFVAVEKQESDLERRAKSAGLIVQDENKRHGAMINFKKGLVMSLGQKAEKEFPELKVGSIVYYNPHDFDEIGEKEETLRLVDSAAIVAMEV